MDDVTRSWLLRPEPARDPELRLDRLASIEVGGGGELTVQTVGGRRFSGHVTRRGEAVRLRVGPAAAVSELLADDLAEQPGRRVDLEKWRDALLRFAPTLTGPGVGTGLLTDADGRPHGWMVSLPLGPDDAVFGGGECFQAVDLRGRTRRGVNLEVHGAGNLDSAYLTVPFFWTDSGSGIFVNTSAPAVADCGSSHAETLALTTVDAALDVFLYAGSPEQILASHTAVTGRPGRLPEWALGVWTSRCSYFSAAEIDTILDRYAAAGCPVDVVHVDAWQVGDVIADLTTAWEVDRDRFPLGWGKRLADRGVRLSLWHNPYLRADTAVGEEAIRLGYVLRDDAGDLVHTNDMPDRLVVDFTSPDAVRWWQGLVTGLVESEGAASIKGDFAEEVPPRARCADGRSGWEVRNSYAVLYQRATYDALCDATGTDDVVMFNRSGTAGAQRCPGHWVGDTPSSWSGLIAAVRACLSLSLSGFGVVSSDVGGFWTEHRVSSAETDVAWHDRPYEPDVDGELFVRWTQLGVLSPLLRFHGTGAREPWAYPAPYGDLAVAATRLRPRLRPYLARAADDAARHGTPMMRPMPLAFPDERSARDALQYLLGPDLLVAPVLRPDGRVDVWTPPGEWRGLAGAPTLHGAGWHTLTLSLEMLPAWVRAGAEVLA